jgi:DNA-3-methyladenine glycosylase II
MEYIAQLSKDKKLKKLLDAQGYLQLKKQKNIFLYLCASIISQQLSVRVAEVIYKRFTNLFNQEPDANSVLALPTEKLRSIGLSGSKTAYIQNVSRFELEYGMQAKKLNKMSNEEVIIYLTQIKGVGRWTAEMLLMFALAREDVFAADDLGIQLAMSKLYKLNSSDKKQVKNQIIAISNNWIPYRTYACLHLWKFMDTK